MAHFCLHMEEECSPIPKRKTAFYGLSLASEKTDCFTVEAKISGASHINEPAFVFISGVESSELLPEKTVVVTIRL